MIIAGGGCSGLTAALYAARAGLSVLIIEGETVGGQIASAPVVENFPGLKSISGAQFANNLFEQVTEYGVDFELERVVKIEDGSVKRVYTEDEVFEGKTVIIASGAKHRHLGIDGEDRLCGSGVSYCAVCDGAFFKGKTVAVAGGGNSAAAAAEFLSGLCNKVYIVHRRDTFRFSDRYLQRLQKLDNIEFITNAEIDSLIGENSLEGIRLKNGQIIDSDALFVCIGQEPDNEAYNSLVELDEDGYIISGENCITNVPGIFAAGDCRRKTVRQLVTAAADGACAAISAMEYIKSMK